MTHYDVIKKASKKDMAVILAALVKGLIDDDGPTWKEIVDIMTKFLDEEAPA